MALFPEQFVGQHCRHPALKMPQFGTGLVDHAWRGGLSSTPLFPSELSLADTARPARPAVGRPRIVADVRPQTSCVPAGGPRMQRGGLDGIVKNRSSLAVQLDVFHPASLQTTRPPKALIDGGVRVLGARRESCRSVGHPDPRRRNATKCSEVFVDRSWHFSCVVSRYRHETSTAPDHGRLTFETLCEEQLVVPMLDITAQCSI